MKDNNWIDGGTLIFDIEKELYKVGQKFKDKYGNEYELKQDSNGIWFLGDDTQFECGVGQFINNEFIEIKE